MYGVMSCCGRGCRTEDEAPHARTMKSRLGLPGSAPHATFLVSDSLILRIQVRARLRD